MKSFRKFIEQESPLAPMPTNPEGNDKDKSYDSSVFHREFDIDPDTADGIGEVITVFLPLPKQGGLQASGPVNVKVLQNIKNSHGHATRIQLQVVGDLLNKQKVTNAAGAVSKLPYPTTPFWVSGHDFEMMKLMPFNKAGAGAGGQIAGPGLGGSPMGGMGI